MMSRDNIYLREALKILIEANSFNFLDPPPLRRRRENFLHTIPYLGVILVSRKNFTLSHLIYKFFADNLVRRDIDLNLDAIYGRIFSSIFLENLKILCENFAHDTLPWFTFGIQDNFWSNFILSHLMYRFFAHNLVCRDIYPDLDVI